MEMERGSAGSDTEGFVRGFALYFFFLGWAGGPWEYSIDYDMAWHGLGSVVFFARFAWWSIYLVITSLLQTILWH